MDTNNKGQGDLQNDNNQAPPTADLNSTNQGNVGLEGLFNSKTQPNSTVDTNSDILPEEFKDLAQDGFIEASNSDLSNPADSSDSSSTVKKDEEWSSNKELSSEDRPDPDNVSNTTSKDSNTGIVKQQSEGEGTQEVREPLQDTTQDRTGTETSFEDLFGISDEDDNNSESLQATTLKADNNGNVSEGASGIAGAIGAFLTGVFWILVLLVTALAFVIAYLYGYKGRFDVRYLKELTQQKICEYCVNEAKLTSIKSLVFKKEPEVSPSPTTLEENIKKMVAEQFKVVCKDRAYWEISFNLSVQSNEPIVDLSVNFEPALEIQELYVDSSKIDFSKKGEEYTFSFASNVTKRVRLLVKVNKEIKKYTLKIKGKGGTKESFMLAGFPDCKSELTVSVNPTKGQQNDSDTLLPSNSVSVTPPRTGIASFVLPAVGIIIVLVGTYLYLFGGLINLGQRFKE